MLTTNNNKNKHPQTFSAFQSEIHLCDHRRSKSTHDMHVCECALHSEKTYTYCIRCTWVHWKNERCREMNESDATHWHVFLKFHLLCHCLTNCSTYSKHSCQQLGSKWGLHTPYTILHTMLNFFFFFFFKESCFCYCPSPLTLVWSQFMFFFLFLPRTLITINTDIKATYSIHIILLHDNEPHFHHQTDHLWISDECLLWGNGEHWNALNWQHGHHYVM